MYLMFTCVQKSQGVFFNRQLHQFLASSQKKKQFVSGSSTLTSARWKTGSGHLVTFLAISDAEKKTGLNGTQNYWDPNNPHSSGKK